jgi:hypothetical protein
MKLVFLKKRLNTSLLKKYNNLDYIFYLTRKHEEKTSNTLKKKICFNKTFGKKLAQLNFFSLSKTLSYKFPLNLKLLDKNYDNLLNLEKNIVFLKFKNYILVQCNSFIFKYVSFLTILKTLFYWFLVPTIFIGFIKLFSKRVSF